MLEGAQPAQQAPVPDQEVQEGGGGRCMGREEGGDIRVARVKGKALAGGERTGGGDPTRVHRVQVLACMAGDVTNKVPSCSLGQEWVRLVPAFVHSPETPCTHLW